MGPVEQPTTEPSPQPRWRAPQRALCGVVALALAAVAVVLLIPVVSAVIPGKIDRPRPIAGRVDPLGIIRLPQPADENVFTGFPLTPRLGFVGAEACRECHEEKMNGFEATGHHRSSELASEESIDARFREKMGTVRSNVPALHYLLEDRDDGFYQTAVVESKLEKYRHSERFDLVIGSGNKGETYTYYRGNQLYQLPLAYVRELDDWTGNPGLNEAFAHYSRRVTAACMFCHSTCFDDTVPLSEHGKPGHVIVGISCERCHGPGKEHVEHHRQHRDDATARHILNPSTLPRLRQLDICGQCHSGSIVVDSAFRPGDVLADFIRHRSERKGAADGAIASSQPTDDFHGLNQLAQLAKSRCYQKSDDMTCTTCHNPHVDEHGKIELFSKRCQACHEPEACDMHLSLGERIASNCIDCHMPSKTDRSLTMPSAEHPTYSPTMHDHVIGRNREIGERIRDSWLRGTKNGRGSLGVPRTSGQKQNGAGEKAR